MEMIVSIKNKLCWEVKKFIAREVRAIWCKCLGIFLEVLVTSIANYWFENES